MGKWRGAATGKSLAQAGQLSTIVGRPGAVASQSAAVLEPPTGVAGLDDVTMVGQPVEHGGGHFGVAEHQRPIGECQIGGDKQRGARWLQSSGQVGGEDKLFPD